MKSRDCYTPIDGISGRPMGCDRPGRVTSFLTYLSESRTTVNTRDRSWKDPDRARPLTAMRFEWATS